MGSDVAGIVMAVSEGPGVSTCRVNVGDRVFGDIGANTRTKTKQKTKELGAYAEYVVALDTQVAIVPTNLSLLEAASLPKVALTSMKALAWYGGARNASFVGAKVLILGGSGGTGTTGIQLARYFGASKITTTTSGPNVKYCKGIGADVVINYQNENWWDMNVTSDNMYDLVYDTVGQPGTGNRAMRIVKKGGYYVTITGTLATKVKEGVTQSMFINSDTNLNSVLLMNEIAQIISLGALRMKRLSMPYSLKNMNDGFALSQEGHVVGKLVVTAQGGGGHITHV